MTKGKICSFITLGCKVNQYETDLMTQSLLDEGYNVRELCSETDFVIINTCTVTNEADRKSRQMIRRAARLSQHITTIAVGCSVQVNSEAVKKDADYQFGNGDKANIAQILKKIEQNAPINASKKAYWLEHDALDYSLKRAGSKTRQFLMVQEGCDNCCSYCKIYHARGTKLVSKSPERVVQEIQNCVESSAVKEFVLTGINLGSYNWGGMNLAGLMEYIDKNAAEEVRIRISSLNPDDITDEICQILKSKRFCPHLHISIQSGSNTVLNRMNRNYTREDIIAAITKLRTLDPLFSVSCDIIVGFPGETAKEFSDTLELIKQIKPLKTHVFRYSKKQGTPAATYSNQIDAEIKKRRSKKLTKYAFEISSQARMRHLNELRSIIVETSDEEYTTGHDEYYIKHLCESNGMIHKEGERLFVKADSFTINNESDEVKSKIESISQ